MTHRAGTDRMEEVAGQKTNTASLSWHIRTHVPSGAVQQKKVHVGQIRKSNEVKEDSKGTRAREKGMQKK